MTLGEAVYKRINELLYEKGISMYELTKLSGIPKSTIKNLGNKHTKNPGLDIIYKLADAFNMTILEFLNCPYLLKNSELDYL